MQKKLKQYAFIAIAIAIPLLLIRLYFIYSDYHPSTDDASVQVDVVNVASIVQGRVVGIYAENQHVVKKGERLFAVDPLPYELALQAAHARLAQAKQSLSSGQSEVDSAKAMVAQAQSQYDLAQKEAARVLPLIKTKDLPAVQGDKVRANLATATAMLDSAKSQLTSAKTKLGPENNANPAIQAAEADVKKAQYELENTTYKSPMNGEIANMSFSIGDIVSAGRILFVIVPNSHYQVVANFKETQLTHIKLGSPASIEISMYPGVTFKGVVTSISKGSTESFSLLPPQNSTGNWVNIAKRYAVTIDFVKLDPRYALRLGASCSVRVN